MRMPRERMRYLAVSCSASLIASLRVTAGLDGTEFSGGWLTGPLLSMAEIGMVLLLLTVIASVVFSRTAAIIGLVSSLLCFPLYLYLIAPAFFVRIFASTHEFSVPLNGNLHWQKWTGAGVVALTVTIYICIRIFMATGPVLIREQS